MGLESSSPQRYRERHPNEMAHAHLQSSSDASSSDGLSPHNTVTPGILSSPPPIVSSHFAHINLQSTGMSSSPGYPVTSPSSLTPPPVDLERPLRDVGIKPAPSHVADTLMDFEVPQHLLELTSNNVNELPEDMQRNRLLEASQLLQQATGTISKFQKMVSQMKLQNQLLAIETHEASQRFEVEKSIVQREVDRLRYEQIDYQHSMAATLGNRSDTETYRRRLQRAKMRLKDAAREIEDRDKDLAKIRKLLKAGRVERQALEAALQKQNTSQEGSAKPGSVQLSPPTGTFLGNLRPTLPTTPQQPTNRGMDNLGFLAFNALSNQPRYEQQQQEQPRNRSVPPVSADFPQFAPNRAGEAINLPPLRLAGENQLRSATPPFSQGQPSEAATLLSPVAFKETAAAGDSQSGTAPAPRRESLPALGSAFSLQQHQQQNTGATELSAGRRDSSGSTITVSSDGEDPQVQQQRQPPASSSNLSSLVHAHDQNPLIVSAIGAAHSSGTPSGSNNNTDDDSDPSPHAASTFIIKPPPHFPESPRSPHKPIVGAGAASQHAGRTTGFPGGPGLGSSPLSGATSSSGPFAGTFKVVDQNPRTPPSH